MSFSRSKFFNPINYAFYAWQPVEYSHHSESDAHADASSTYCTNTVPFKFFLDECAPGT
jgi:hypothetical protein